jgi:raffinose/stachyose/melibiose transport system permease protein
VGTFPATFGRGRPMTGKRRRRRRIAGRTLLYAIAWVVAILTLLPLIYAILGGFRTTAQIAADPIALPSPWVLSNYTDLVRSSTFLRELFNSALIALVSTLLVVPLAAFAAYVLRASPSAAASCSTRSSRSGCCSPSPSRSCRSS